MLELGSRSQVSSMQFFWGGRVGEQACGWSSQKPGTWWRRCPLDMVPLDLMPLGHHTFFGKTLLCVCVVCACTRTRA